MSVSEEVDEIYRRLTKALKDRTEHLRGEIDRYLSNELRNLTQLKENLGLEITNITSNCDLVDKYMTESIDWDDCELMDTKEIFLKTVEFMRSFEYENTDYNRRVRFIMANDPNQLVMNVSTYGDLNIAHPPATSPSNSTTHLQAPSGPGLMRSKSDHRLAAQFRQQQEERGYALEDEPVLGGRKFGERAAQRTTNPERYGNETSRYGRSTANEYDYEHDNDPSSRSNKSRFRSRFVRDRDNDSDNEQNRSVRFHDKDGTNAGVGSGGKADKERERVIDTEDVTRGHLSGIIRLTDSPRVMKRLQEQDNPVKREIKKEPITVTPAVTQPVTPKRAPLATRQVSEDDEIARIKRQNKGATSSTTNTANAPAGVTDTPTERPAAERVAALKPSEPSSPVRRTPPQTDVY